MAEILEFRNRIEEDSSEDRGYDSDVFRGMVEDYLLALDYERIDVNTPEGAKELGDLLLDFPEDQFEKNLDERRGMVMGYLLSLNPYRMNVFEKILDNMAETWNSKAEGYKGEIARQFNKIDNRYRPKKEEKKEPTSCSSGNL